MRSCIQNHHLQWKPSWFVSLEKCTQCHLSGGKVVLSSYGPCRLLGVSWEWGHSVWMFATHLRRDAGWRQSLKEELRERLLKIQSCVDFLKQCLTWMKDPADPGERYRQPWEGDSRKTCFHLPCSLLSSDATFYNKSYLLRISFSLGLHGQQNLCENIMTSMAIVISKGSRVISDLLCGLETRVSVEISAKDGLCGSPAFPLCITLCVPFCSECWADGLDWHRLTFNSCFFCDTKWGEIHFLLAAVRVPLWWCWQKFVCSCIYVGKFPLVWFFSKVSPAFCFCCMVSLCPWGKLQCPNVASLSSYDSPSLLLSCM